MSDAGSGSDEFMAGVRLIVLNLPEDEGEGLGFRLTRTLWDPYPWVHEVVPGARADTAGLKTGDCLLQADGKDLLGLPVSQVASLIRGDGTGGGVSLLVWNCGVDPKEDPELLWSCGGGARGERARRALAGVLRALSCCVCAATAAGALCCARSHLYCEACWKRLERCALCREQLPAKNSPYAKNLVAEQVFETIATEYEIKESIRRPVDTASAYSSPNRSPNVSPAPSRRGQYQLSMMNRFKKTVQFNEKYSPNYSSDSNIPRSVKQEVFRRIPTAEFVQTGNTTNGAKITTCQCQNTCSTNVNLENQMPSKDTLHNSIPKINIENADCNMNECKNIYLQHKLVTRLRPACSLADLQNVALPNCQLSRSLNNVNSSDQSCSQAHSNSMENLKNNLHPSCDSPVLLLPSMPVFIMACEHSSNN